MRQDKRLEDLEKIISFCPEGERRKVVTIEHFQAADEYRISATGEFLSVTQFKVMEAANTVILIERN